MTKLAKKKIRAVRERRPSARISALHDEQGTRVTERTAVEACALAYSTDLYAAASRSSQADLAEATILGLLLNTLVDRFPIIIIIVIAALDRILDNAELRNCPRADVQWEEFRA